MTALVPAAGNAPVPRDAAGWAVVIRADLQRTAAGIIAAGAHLAGAKAVVPAAEWRQWLRRELGLSVSAASKMMIIARNQVLAELSTSKTQAQLPASAEALYQLTFVPEDRLRAVLADGQAMAGMTVARAKKLAKDSGEAGSRPPAPGMRSGRTGKRKDGQGEAETPAGATAEEARARADRIRQALRFADKIADALAVQSGEAVAARDWEALGYLTWHDYVYREFAKRRFRGAARPGILDRIREELAGLVPRSPRPPLWLSREETQAMIDRSKALAKRLPPSKTTPMEVIQIKGRPAEPGEIPRPQGPGPEAPYLGARNAIEQHWEMEAAAEVAAAERRQGRGWPSRASSTSPA